MKSAKRQIPNVVVTLVFYVSRQRLVICCLQSLTYSVFSVIQTGSSVNLDYQEYCTCYCFKYVNSLKIITMPKIDTFI